MITQGNQGEILAVCWLRSQGWGIALPIGNCSDYDVIADADGRLLRVQVKTTRVLRAGRWVVTLATRGGNRSWTGATKLFSPARCDHLYAHTRCGRRWFLPSSEIEGPQVRAV
jgi:hypothetical protein